MTSFEQRKYYFTPVVVNGNRELDLLKTELTAITLETAAYHRITHATENRPDLIAKIYFDNFDLGWLICYHNKLVDPFVDFYIGREIAIPYIDDYYQFFNRFAKELD